MSRAFDDGSSQYLEVGSTPVSAAPLTVAAWFKTDDLTADQTIISIVNSVSGVDYFVLQFGGSSYSDQIAFEVLDGSAVDGTCNTSSAASANTWHHACGVAASLSSRAVYLDGGSKGTDTAGLSAHSTNTIGIGRNSDSTPSDYLSGSAAEIAIWNAALSDAEVAQLALGYSPLLIKPLNLVFYLPAIRDGDRDIVGGLSLTPSGSPTVSAHPRIIYPAPQLWVPAPAAAGGALIQLSATLTWQTATPSATLAIQRQLTATHTWSAATPDIAALVVERQLSATSGWATTTPDVVTLVVLRQLATTSAWQTATPDITSLAIQRQLTATVAWQSSTTDTAILAIARLLASTLSWQTTTNDAANLNVAKILAAVIGWQTTTPDTASLAIARQLSPTIDWQSTTPDIATIIILRQLVAISTWQSTTPDDATLTVEEGGYIDLLEPLFIRRAIPAGIFDI